MVDSLTTLDLVIVVTAFSVGSWFLARYGCARQFRSALEVIHEGMPASRVAFGLVGFGLSYLLLVPMFLGPILGLIHLGRGDFQGGMILILASIYAMAGFALGEIFGEDWFEDMWIGKKLALALAFGVLIPGITVLTIARPI